MTNVLSFISRLTYTGNFDKQYVIKKLINDVYGNPRSDARTNECVKEIKFNEFVIIWLKNHLL